MKSDAIAFGIAGVAFGLIAGWVIGSQQTTARVPAAAVQPVAPEATSASAPAVLDQAQVNALKSVAERDGSRGLEAAIPKTSARCSPGRCAR